MKPVLSVVIASLNEHWATLNKTVESIRATAGYWVEVVIVDDCSSTAVKVSDPETKVLHNAKRLGVGPSRHIGVEAASSNLILITDSHMVFCAGWLDALMQTLPGSEHLVLCGKCLALSETCDDPNHPEGEYQGARMVIHDPGAELRWRILTAKWAEDRLGKDFYLLSAIMGAAYSMHKSWFLHIGGLKILRGFGIDEELLSLRTIRAGGHLRMFKALRVGHKFRKRVKPPFSITIEESLANTIALALTSVPALEAGVLIDALGRDKPVLRALSMVNLRANEISQEQERLASVLQMPWNEYLDLIKEIDQR